MDQTDLLIPGAIWMREAKGKQFFSTIVCVTNTHLPEEKQAQMPPQVVYRDQRGRFNSTGIDSFTKRRSYVDLDPDVARNVQEIIEPPEVSEHEIPTIEESSVAEEINSGETISFIQFDADVVPPVHQSVLQQNLATYRQIPVPEAQAIQHELIFQVSQELSRKDLRDSFSQSNPNFYCAFVVNSELVDPDIFLGVYPMLAGSEEYVVAVFRTSANYQQDADEQIEVPPVSEVQVSPTGTSAPVDDSMRVYTGSPVDITTSISQNAVPTTVSEAAQTVANNIV